MTDPPTNKIEENFWLGNFDFDSLGAIYVKMNGSVLEDKSSFKMLGLPFSSNSD